MMARSRLLCAPCLCSRLLLAALLVSCFAVIVAATRDEDKLALLAFKAGIIRYPFGSLRSWNESADFCRWHGVMYGRRHRRVVALDLNSQGLSGPISPHIGNLSFLKEMKLQNNSFASKMPPQIGHLRRLALLNLSHNSLTGQIPKNISGCSNLIMLSLGHNQLVGGIPVEIGSLSNLRFISFAANQLTDSIPSSIRNLSSLKVIYCSYNGLSGVIPHSLGRLTKLEELNIRGNRISGTIPPSLFNISSLIAIDIGENQIRGNLPDDIGFILPHLQFMGFDNNQFSGHVPSSISNATSLEMLQLNTNRLSGSAPSLARLNNIKWVAIYENHLGSGGSDADELSFLCLLRNATNLIAVGIEGNRFGGTLPRCIGNLSTTLIVIAVGYNLISGEIPKEISNLVNLWRLRMEDNLYSGPIPSDLGNLTNLGELRLSGNDLSGIIPSSLQYLRRLIVLLLDGNNFEGPVPSYLGKCQTLTNLDLSSNTLSGPIIFPVAESLVYLNLSGNYDGLRILRMQDNLFSGPIPQSISSLRSIEELDLSKNSLYGGIPMFLEAFQYLEKLNLSYNHLEGPLPTQGVFRNVSATFVTGNEKLCGGMPEFELPECISRNSKSRHGISKLKLTIVVAFSLFGTLLAVIFLYLCWLKHKKNDSISISLDDSMLNLSYGTLLKATDGFSSTNLVGVGNFGCVYKGLLQDNGSVIAVKVLDLTRHDALKSFKAECEVLKGIKHRNLMKVLTACSGIEYKGDEFKALVYEFMVNGSLEEWLHPNPGINDLDGHSKKLSLVQRINISIDVASALDYLHNQCQSPIIHCDLKPSNILLDTDMVGHIGDFGLAKMVLTSMSGTGANPSSISLRGTIGYAAPEYASGSTVSKEGDVYGYGILLLEMFTGLCPTSDMLKDNLNLHNYVAEALPQRAIEITDPVLLHVGDSHHSSKDALHERNGIFLESLETIYRIGLACSVEEPRRRMSIDKVATQLHSMRKKLFAPSLPGWMRNE